MSERKYIGIDLGAWYGNKTRIAVLKEDKKNKLKPMLVFLGDEPLKTTKEPKKKNKKLIEWIRTEANGNALIAIDAPFAVPSPLSKNTEDYYPIECTPAMKNQYLYDNSARFVYEITDHQVQVLAPTATLVGALTSRMVHMVDNYFNILGICKTPYLETTKKGVSTIEVFPRAALVKIIEKKHFETEKIPEYKNKKTKEEYFQNKEGSGKDKMLDLIKPYITNLDEWEKEIKTDDDYDAIICALTAYWVDKEDGYEKPADEDIEKFTNSFIYIPKIK